MTRTWFIEQFLTTNFIATIAVAFILLMSRFLLARYIRRSDHNWTAQQRLRWIGSMRTTIFIVLMLSVIFIWGEAIQGFAVSVFAIAFALVFSIKETFINLNGSLVRFRGKLYEIGDRIEIKGMRGDVINIGLLSTTLMEIGVGAANHKFTGRRISFSNSLLLTEFVANESFLEHYYMNNIKIPLKISADWKMAKQILLKIAREECAPYLEQARTRLREMEKRRSLELPSVEPIVSIQIPNPELIDLYLRIPSPAHLKGRLEQVVITRFLEQFLGQSSAKVDGELKISPEELDPASPLRQYSTDL